MYKGVHYVSTSLAMHSKTCLPKGATLSRAQGRRTHISNSQHVLLLSHVMPRPVWGSKGCVVAIIRVQYIKMCHANGYNSLQSVHIVYTTCTCSGPSKPTFLYFSYLFPATFSVFSCVTYCLQRSILFLLSKLFSSSPSSIGYRNCWVTHLK